MLVCPFGPKIRRVGRSFFLNSGCGRNAVPFMCVHSWACRTSELNLMLVLKGGCIPLYLVKEPFWDSYEKILTFYLNILVNFLSKNAKLSIKKKKPTLFFQYFRSVGKGQTNIFLSLILRERILRIFCN